MAWKKVRKIIIEWDDSTHSELYITENFTAKDITIQLVVPKHTKE